jgi:hypothetical protein
MIKQKKLESIVIEILIKTSLIFDLKILQNIGKLISLIKLF